MSDKELFELLKGFCRAEGPDGKMSTPFNIDDFSYATNGHMIIRCKRVNGVTVKDNAPDINNLPWDHEKIKDWAECPDVLVEGKKCECCDGKKVSVECEECDGDGWVDLFNEYHHYENECKSCHGKGAVCGVGKEDPMNCSNCYATGIDYGREGLVWNNVKISNKIVAKLKILPGIKMQVVGGKEDPVRFIFDHGVGLAMPMRY